MIWLWILGYVAIGLIGSLLLVYFDVGKTFDGIEIIWSWGWPFILFFLMIWLPIGAFKGLLLFVTEAGYKRRKEKDKRQGCL